MISIVVPIYNAEEYLKKCIDSVIFQSYKDFELLLVDDGSSDRSLSICKEYEKIDCRVKTIVGNHKGPYYARKIGVENAQGDYITFIDADDFVSKEAYILAKEDMQASVDIISFDIFRYFYDDNIRYDGCSIPERIYNRQDITDHVFPVMIWDDSRISFGIDPSLCNKLYKASLLKDHYSTSRNLGFHYGEDIAVIYPLISKAQRLSVHHKAYYYHRQRPKSILPSYIEDKHYLDKLYELYRYLSDCMDFSEIFQRQIDLFYIHSVELAKKKWGIITYPQDAIFPFDKIKKNEKIILYGAGNFGRMYVKQLNMLNFCSIVLWVDKNYEQFDSEICSPEEISKTDYDKIVIAIANQNVKNQVIEYLAGLGINKENIV